jgi:uncharacterized membrane protein
MSELIAAGFRGTNRAAESLADVVGREPLLAILLQDAVAGYRIGDGKLHLAGSGQRRTARGAV